MISIHGIYPVVYKQIFLFRTCNLNAKTDYQSATEAARKRVQSKLIRCLGGKKVEQWSGKSLTAYDV